MTVHKHFKQLIRARMEKTGERYAAARRSVIATAGAASIVRTGDRIQEDAATRWHFAGNVPATTALRTLLTHAGVRAPHTGAPLSEAMLFGIAGGIGIGVFSFYYEKADMATFFISGRHEWHDDNAYLCDALGDFGIEPVIQETSGGRTAAKQLEDALNQYGPCVAWVDMASLPHRAMPESFRGATYHVVTVYDIDATAGTARIGDLTDDPVSISLADLTEARMRIKKQRCRLLSIPAAPNNPTLTALVDGGLRRCSEGLLHPSIPQGKNNARLEALQTWANRMHGSGDKESWSRIFRPGPNLWRGLWSIYTFIESYGTGGGLCRPLFADFLKEAGAALSRPELTALSEQYAALGRAWSDLAHAALPDSAPALRAARELHCRKAECVHGGDQTEELRAMWKQQQELQQQPFPLSEAECENLRAELRARIMDLYQGEVAAHTALRKLIAE